MSERESTLQGRLDAVGEASPPLENGELVFEAPWEARAFGLAHTLCDAGCFAWEEFRERLIDEIGRWEARARPGEPYCYYERWLAALERLLVEKGLTDASALAARAGALAARPHGHDHGASSPRSAGRRSR